MKYELRCKPNFNRSKITNSSNLESAIKKNEKSLNFTEIPTLQKQINKLKKIEEKRVLQKIEQTHKKEKDFLSTKYNKVYSSYSNKKDNETKFFVNKINNMKKKFDLKQKTELENFSKKFEDEYPKEDPLIQDIIKMKDRINYFAKKRDYENAQKLTNEMEEFKQNKHEEYITVKNREYNFALEKLKYFQSREKEEMDQKINNLIWEHNYNSNSEMSTLERTKLKKFKTLSTIQNDEMNTLKNYIYYQNKKRGLSISKAIARIHA